MLDCLADFLEDARHAHDDRRADFAHGLGELVELRAVDDLRAGVVHDVVEGARGDVREGQEGDAGIGGVETEIQGSKILVGSNVAVGEGDAFGLACGAGCVDECGEVLGLDRLYKGVEYRVALCAADVEVVDQGVERDGAVGRRGIHNDNAVELGEGATRS